ncbi:MAG TPA: type III pantothenate kinase [Candidatus Kapabacteria bacterium]
MFIAIDIGNTRTTCGVFQGEFLETLINFPTLRGDTKTISDEAKKQFALFKDIQDACIASVVPKATYPTSDALKEIFGDIEIRVLSHDDIPIDCAYKNPDEVGTDRLLGSLAAYTKYGSADKKSIVVIDLGTATVFDCVDKDGTYLGGAIALGIESGAKHLSTIAAQLPPVPLEFPKRVLGKTTEDSMRSGILFGAVSMVEGMVKRLTEEVFPKQQPIVVATGGLARILTEHAPFISHYEANLVLNGIRISHDQKKK